jgi:hypothetical protein
MREGWSEQAGWARAAANYHDLCYHASTVLVKINLKGNWK